MCASELDEALSTGSLLGGGLAGVSASVAAGGFFGGVEMIGTGSSLTVGSSLVVFFFFFFFGLFFFFLPVVEGRSSSSSASSTVA